MPTRSWHGDLDFLVVNKNPAAESSDSPVLLHEKKGGPNGGPMEASITSL